MHTPQKPTVSYDTAMSLDIRMCHVESAEPILKNPKKPPGDDNPVKAYALTINTGLDKRVAVTNVVPVSPELFFIGRTMPFILNLEPTTIRGVLSSAMIVCASKDGKVMDTLQVADDDRTPGADIIGWEVL